MSTVHIRQCSESKALSGEKVIAGREVGCDFSEVSDEVSARACDNRWTRPSCSNEMGGESSPDTSMISEDCRAVCVRCMPH